MEQVDLVLSLIGGTSGAGVIVAMLVGFVKSIWKPNNKKLYWIPASIFSLLSTIGIFWYVEMLELSFVNILLILVFSAYTAFYEYIANNEQFAKLKPLLKKILRALFKRA